MSGVFYSVWLGKLLKFSERVLLLEAIYTLIQPFVGQRVPGETGLSPRLSPAQDRHSGLTDQPLTRHLEEEQKTNKRAELLRWIDVRSRSKPLARVIRSGSTTCDHDTRCGSPVKAAATFP